MMAKNLLCLMMLLFGVVLLLDLVSAASLSSGDYSFVVLDDHFGGLVVDDGDNYFLITAGAVGFLPNAEGTVFYTLPPFLSSDSQGGGGSGDSSGGGGQRPDETFLDEEIGLFMIHETSDFPTVVCDVRLENYRSSDVVLDYRWWVSDNLMNDYDDTLGGLMNDVVVESGSYHSAAHSLKVSKEGDYWCKVEVTRIDGGKVFSVAQRADVVSGFDINHFIDDFDWQELVLYGLLGLLLGLLLVWSFGFIRRGRSNKGFKRPA